MLRDSRHPLIVLFGRLGRKLIVVFGFAVYAGEQLGALLRGGGAFEFCAGMGGGVVSELSRLNPSYARPIVPAIESTARVRRLPRSQV